MRFPAGLLSEIVKEATPPRVFLVALSNAPDNPFLAWMELRPGEKTMANAVSVNVGHLVDMSIVFLDQNGNPMLVAPKPDAVPGWSNSTPATGTLVAAADGMSAVETAVAVGSDVVTLALAVGGKQFTAALPINVAAAPQVFTSVDIVATVK